MRRSDRHASPAGVARSRAVAPLPRSRPADRPARDLRGLRTESIHESPDLDGSIAAAGPGCPAGPRPAAAAAGPGTTPAPPRRPGHGQAAGPRREDVAEKDQARDVRPEGLVTPNASVDPKKVVDVVKEEVKGGEAQRGPDAAQSPLCLSRPTSRSRTSR